MNCNRLACRNAVGFAEHLDVQGQRDSQSGGLLRETPDVDTERSPFVAVLVEDRLHVPELLLLRSLPFIRAAEVLLQRDRHRSAVAQDLVVEAGHIPLCALLRSMGSPDRELRRLIAVVAVCG